MKKSILLLALLLPLGLSAQWSVVPNAGVYISWQDTGGYNNDGFGAGFDGQLMFRYNFSGFYVSSGLGYQYLTAFDIDEDYYYTEYYPHYGPSYDYYDYSSYSNIRIPVMVGYHLNTRVAPVVELGMAVSVPLNLHTSYSNNLHGRQETKDAVLSFLASAGIRFAFNNGNALEAKSTFTGSGNVAASGLERSSWYGFGFNIAYEISL